MAEWVNGDGAEPSATNRPSTPSCGRAPTPSAPVIPPRPTPIAAVQPHRRRRPRIGPIVAAGLCIGLVALGLAYRGPLLDRFKPSTDTLTNESGESPLATPDASPSATNPTTGSLPVPGEPGATVKRNRLSRDGLRYSLWGDVQDHGCDGEVLRECALLAAPDGQGVVLVQSFRSQWDEDSDVQLTALGMLLVSEMAAAKGAPEPTDGALVDIGDKSVYTATTFPSNLEVHNSVMIGNGWVVLVQSIAPSGVTSSYDDVVRSVRFPG